MYDYNRLTLLLFRRTERGRGGTDGTTTRELTAGAPEPNPSKINTALIHLSVPGRHPLFIPIFQQACDAKGARTGRGEPETIRALTLSLCHRSKLGGGCTLSRVRGYRCISSIFGGDDAPPSLPHHVLPGLTGYIVKHGGDIERESVRIWG